MSAGNGQAPQPERIRRDLAGEGLTARTLDQQAYVLARHNHDIAKLQTRTYSDTLRIIRLEAQIDLFTSKSLWARLWWLVRGR